MCQGQLPELVCGPAQLRLPVRDISRNDELGQDELDDAVEELGSVRGVPVQRHGIAVELLTEPAHGQDVQPVLVEEAQGCLQHDVPAQPRPSGCAAAALGHPALRPAKSSTM